MNIRIFTVYHRIPDAFVANDVFSPFVTGLTSPHQPLPYVTDNNYLNIADRTSYAEMRAHYYVWKNLMSDLDFVGFQHYRRAFLYYFMMEANAASELAAMSAARIKNRSVPPQPVDRPTFDRYLQWLRDWDSAKMLLFREWVSHFDIVVPPAEIFPAGLGQQYAKWHRAEDWQLLTGVLQKHPRLEKLSHCLDLNLKHLHPCNMFIVRSSIFIDYMSFWYDVMTALEPLIAISDDPYQSRVFGFLSERVFTIYLYHLRVEQPALRIAELPYLVYEPVEPSSTSVEATRAASSVARSIAGEPPVESFMSGTAEIVSDPEKAKSAGGGGDGDALGSMTRMITSLCKATAASEARIARIEREWRERGTAVDAEAASLRAEIGASEARLTDLLVEAGGRQAAHESEIARLTDSVTALCKALAASDTRFLALERQSAERQRVADEEIARLQAQSAARDAGLARLELDIAKERGASAAQLFSLQARLQATADAIAAQLGALRGRLWRHVAGGDRDADRDARSRP